MYKIAAAIILYNPNVSLLLENLKSIYPQVSEVIIVDNGSREWFEVEKALRKWKLCIIKNKINEGIARALNQAFSIAKGKGYEYLITLDQDSVCDSDIVSSLYKLIKNNIGIVCPGIRFKYSKDLIFYTLSKRASIDACITSGSLTSVKAWSVVHGFDEFMFIDHVDNDFCMRLKLNKFKIIRNNNTFLNQRAGQMKCLHLPFGLKLRLYGYNSTRQYYITRNTIYFTFKYWRYCNYLKKLISLVLFQIVVIAFEKKRVKNIIAMCRGYYDAFCRISTMKSL